MKYIYFDVKSINILKSIIECYWFYNIINVKSHDFFIGAQGIRQSDPLSLDLYIMVDDYLSKGLS